MQLRVRNCRRDMYRMQLVCGNKQDCICFCILCSVCLEAGAVGGSICHLKTNPSQHLGIPCLPIPAPASPWTPANPTGHHQANLPYRCLTSQTFTGFQIPLGHESCVSLSPTVQLLLSENHRHYKVIRNTEYR